MEGQSTYDQIDISHLNYGIYLISLFFEDQTRTVKFYKK